MSNLIFFSLDGEPKYTSYSTKSGGFADGVTIADSLVFNIPEGISHEDAMATLYVTDGELRSRSPQPSGLHRFHKDTLTWGVDLDRLRYHLVQEAKKGRDAAEFAPFTYNGMTFDGDLDAQRRLSVLVSAAKSAIAAGYSFTKDFTLADNTVVPLTAEDFVGIEMAKLWQVDVAFQEYRLKKAAIEAATTLEELEAITI